MKSETLLLVFPIMVGLLFVALMSGCAALLPGSETKPPTITDIDGNDYETVIIGNQEWFAENLRTTTYNDGLAIPNVKSDRQWLRLSTGAYSWYRNDSINAEIYGAFYNGYAVATGKLCPQGWRVPTNKDWEALTNYLGGRDIAGGKLKKTGTLEAGNGLWRHPNEGATNETGFSALPGGLRSPDDRIKAKGHGYSSWWWSASKRSNDFPSVYYVTSENIKMRRFSQIFFNSIGFSVRCMRDSAKEPITYNLQIKPHPKEAGIVTGEGEYEWDSVVRISASPNESWVFVAWIGDVDYVDDAHSEQTNFTMPAFGVTLTAVFQEKDEPDIVFGDGITDIDGNEYKTVIIGNQEWMAENLRVGKYNNGTDITTGLSSEAWRNTTQGAYAIYPRFSIHGFNSIAEVVSTYGKLYNWYAVKTGNLCPEGWSVPSDDDWINLINYLGGPGIAGGKLKAAGTLEAGNGLWQHPNEGATNETGFSGLPGGRLIGFWRFEDIGTNGYWWSTTTSGPFFANGWSISQNSGNMTQQDMSRKYNGFSVRCFRELGAH